MFIMNVVIMVLLTVCDFFISYDAWSSGEQFEKFMSYALWLNVGLSASSLVMIKIPKAFLQKKLDRYTPEDCASSDAIASSKL